VKFWVPHWVVGLPVGPLSLISDPGRVVHTHVLHDTKQNEVPVNGRWRSADGKQSLVYYMARSICKSAVTTVAVNISNPLDSGMSFVLNRESNYSQLWRTISSHVSMHVSLIFLAYYLAIVRIDHKISRHYFPSFVYSIRPSLYVAISPSKDLFFSAGRRRRSVRERERERERERSPKGAYKNHCIWPIIAYTYILMWGWNLSHICRSHIAAFLGICQWEFRKSV